MGKGKRSRQRRILNDDASRAASKAIADERGAFVDPKSPGLELVDRDAFLAGDSVRDFARESKEQGCVCDPLEVRLNKVALPDGTAAVELLALHEDYCPLLRSVEEGSR